MPRQARQGMVLVVVLVIITMLSLGALTFSELMMAEREGAEVAVVQSQARALADSGVEMARMFVAQDAQVQQQAGGWYDNSSRFRGVGVFVGSTHGTGRFTLVAPKLEDGRLTGIRFGLEDESARLNLNAVVEIDQTSPAENHAGRKILMALPGMTEDVADAILDWMDLNDETREYGAEIDAYAGLSPGYATKNGPLDTIEELLLVRGVTPSLLFGLDTNRNYLIDRAESSGTVVSGIDNSDGSMNSGWGAYLTLHSGESNLRSDGQPKIDLSQSDLKKLYEDLESALGKDWATFIVAYRQSSNGYVSANPSRNRTSPSSYEIDFNKSAGSASLTTVLDLVTPQDKELVVGSGSDQKVLESPFPEGPVVSNAYLPKLLDNCTVGSSGMNPGRVNINLASRPVLAAILSAGAKKSQTDSEQEADLEDPTKIQEIVDQIVSQRPKDPNQDDETFRYETWIYSKGIVTLAEMKNLFPHVCARGSVYRAQVIGYFDKGGPAARIEAIIDATSNPPRIVFWRDMTHLGRGYPLETLGVEALESPAGGNSP